MYHPNFLNHFGKYDSLSSEIHYHIHMMDKLCPFQCNLYFDLVCLIIKVDGVDNIGSILVNTVTEVELVLPTQTELTFINGT